MAELANRYADAVLWGCLADIDCFKKAIDKATSQTLINLMTDVTGGREFRIAFKKKGETDWTRLYFSEPELLKKLALEELVSRQDATMTTLANALGIDSYTITFGD